MCLDVVPRERELKLNASHFSVAESPPHPAGPSDQVSGCANPCLLRCTVSIPPLPPWPCTLHMKIFKQNTTPSHAPSLERHLGAHRVFVLAAGRPAAAAPPTEPG